ncbi:hypothetical protein [Endozoicomonas sp. ALC066]|uniref:hypothetical protein n=1 Tax=Endozoicomonas sp. ALC066 TaxID=3403078 RepID=UPI003BB4E6B2
MQILTEEAQQFIADNRPSWATHFALESSGTIYYFDERPLYHEELGIFVRRSKGGKTKKAQLPRPEIFEI